MEFVRRREKARDAVEESKPPAAAAEEHIGVGNADSEVSTNIGAIRRPKIPKYNKSLVEPATFFPPAAAVGNAVSSNSNNNSISVGLGSASSSSIVGGPPSQASGMKRTLVSRRDQTDRDKWILVTGLLSTGFEHDILKHFHKFGDIDEYSTGGSRGNWVFIKYKLSAYARRASESELQLCDTLKDVLFAVKPLLLVDPAVLDCLESSSGAFSDSLFGRTETAEELESREELATKKYKSAHMVSIDNYLQPRMSKTLLGRLLEHVFM